MIRAFCSNSNSWLLFVELAEDSDTVSSILVEVENIKITEIATEVFS